MPDAAVRENDREAPIKTVWPSGLRRWLQAPVRKGVGSNPTAVIAKIASSCQWTVVGLKD